LKLKLVITIAAVAVILGISTINIYAQFGAQPPLQPLGSSEILEDVAKDQVSQIIGNKKVEDHIKSLGNTSEKCEEKEEENIELRVCSSEEGNKITNDPLGLFVDKSNKTQ
jgi:hypothetical protein